MTEEKITIPIEEYRRIKNNSDQYLSNIEQESRQLLRRAENLAEIDGRKLMVKNCLDSYNKIHRRILKENNIDTQNLDKKVKDITLKLNSGEKSK